MPSTTPMTTAMIDAETETTSENVMPSQIRLSVSRPIPGSTPSGWDQLIPHQSPIGRLSGPIRSWLVV